MYSFSFVVCLKSFFIFIPTGIFQVIDPSQKEEFAFHRTRIDLIFILNIRFKMYIFSILFHEIL